ncbi:MAG: nucleotidyl transferase AbiEii/AbiGii toxin family protein [Vulcanimicrobiaceae bacterium]
MPQVTVPPAEFQAFAFGALCVVSLTFREAYETAHAFRFPMSAKYENVDWSTFDVEITAGDVAGEDLVEPLNLSEFSLESPDPISCLDLYAQIAQKFHGATDPDENRPRDILDIYILRQTYSFDIDRLRISVEGLFAQRSKQSWPAPIELRAGWESVIAGLIDQNKFTCTVAEVLNAVNAFALELMGVTMKVNYECRSRSIASIYRDLRPQPFAEWFQEREESRGQAARVGEERERRQTQRQRQEHDRGQGPFSELDGGIPDSRWIER